MNLGAIQIAFLDEKSIPLFQQFIRDNPPGRDDVHSIPALTSQC